jgi:hypothetical protein
LRWGCGGEEVTPDFLKVTPFANEESEKTLKNHGVTVENNL